MISCSLPEKKPKWLSSSYITHSDCVKLCADKNSRTLTFEKVLRYYHPRTQNQFINNTQNYLLKYLYVIYFLVIPNFSRGFIYPYCAWISCLIFTQLFSAQICAKINTCEILSIKGTISVLGWCCWLELSSFWKQCNGKQTKHGQNTHCPFHSQLVGQPLPIRWSPTKRRRFTTLTLINLDSVDGVYFHIQKT